MAKVEHPHPVHEEDLTMEAVKGVLGGVEAGRHFKGDLMDV